MTSDFENDEIKDSSFPVDFNEDTVSLDMYGVWVKSGPRDIDDTVGKNNGENDFKVVSTTIDASSGTDKHTDFNEIADISDLPELPDFPDIAEVPAQDDTTAVSTIEFEETIPEEIASVTSKESVSFETKEVSSLETVSESVFDAINTEDLLKDSSIPVENESDFLVSEIAEPEINIEDTATINTKDVSEKDFEITEPEETIVLPEEDFTLLDTNFDVVEPDTASLEPEIEIAVPEKETRSTDFDISDFETELENTSDFSGSTATLSSEVSELGGKEETISGFTDVTGFTDMTVPQETEAVSSDDDFSSFLDDLNASSPSVSGDDDLDSFINSINESGGATHEENEKIYDDTEPVNIDLEFDEEFIEDEAKIRATGSSVSESEFFNSEFGVELIDETSGKKEASALNIASESASDVAVARQNENSSSIPEKEDISGLVETSEFDDLLQSLDIAPTPATAHADKKTPIQSTKAFDLVVTEEAGFDAITPTVNETAADEDFEVPLFDVQQSTDETKDRFNAVQTPESTVSGNEKLMSDFGDIQGFELIDMIEPKIDKQEEKTEMPEESASETVTEASFPEVEETPSFEEIEEVSESPIVSFAEENPSDEENLDITEIRDYNSTEFVPESELSGISSLEESVPLDFDDISAVEQELSDLTPDTGDASVVSNDKSTELLMHIADELSSIKKEISTLKTEIAGYKASSQSGESGVQVVASQTVENSGFFSDDDTDETIALTGDELNNILITADFTEEKTEDASIENAKIAVEDESTSVSSQKSEQPTEEINLSEQMKLSEDNEAFEEPVIPETLPDSIFDIPELDNSVSVEASHVNKIEDDVSYLDGSETVEPNLDDVAIEEPDLEVIDFNDEKLEEPELTEFNIDLTDIEKDFPAEQEVAVDLKDEKPIEGIPSEFGESLEDFATSDTLSEQELAAVNENVAGQETAPEIALEVPEDEKTKEPKSASSVTTLPVELKDDIKSVLSYMDQLLESLPEDKIEEFARSEHFEVYKKLFEELGIS